MQPKEKNEQPKEKEALQKSYPNWKDLLSIIAVYFLLSIAVGLAVGLTGKNRLEGFALFWGYCIPMGGTIIYALFLQKLRAGDLRGLVKLSIHGLNPRLILWGVVLMLAISVAIEPLLELVPDQWLEGLNTMVGKGDGWSILTTVIAASILEETLFRGIIQEGLFRKYEPWISIVVSAVIFGAIHVIPQQVVAASLMGLVLGYIYYKTRSLLSVVILHAVNNALALLGLMLSGGEPATLHEEIPIPWIYWTIYVAAALLLIISLVKVVMLIRRGKFQEIARPGRKPEKIDHEAAEN
ncbi:MAG: CPBP family intramembrane metalloprotease [Rikenellaceae bacterium]|jgi:membrane protease YdiL (CAAX protease family)|nr:CPBP family intramembrane metalloprotease [Rikenellaceae bacterium]